MHQGDLCRFSNSNYLLCHTASKPAYTNNIPFCILPVLFAKAISMTQTVTNLTMGKQKLYLCQTQLYLAPTCFYAPDFDHYSIPHVTSIIYYNKLLTEFAYYYGYSPMSAPNLQSVNPDFTLHTAFNAKNKTTKNPVPHLQRATTVNFQ